MLVFRLFRIGKNNQPSFKMVVTDKRNPSKGGRFVEQIGFYNPVTKEKVLNIERAKYWLGQGVQPSDTVHNLFVKEGILEAKKIPVHKKSKKSSTEVKPQSSETPKAAEVKKEEPAKEAKPEEKAAEAKPQESESPKIE